MKTTSVTDCVFCYFPKERIISESERFWVIRDAYPVTEGHTLIIPKRHAETWFDLTDTEQTEANGVLREQRLKLIEQDSTITGFNIGMNCGASAGQTVFHCHIHLIPRLFGQFRHPPILWRHHLGDH
jgi:diadenosine tetraphosphate (Ap4A) HIT family hydrolase